MVIIIIIIVMNINYNYVEFIHKLFIMEEEDTSSGRKRVYDYDNQSRDDTEVVALLPKTKKRRTDNNTHKISDEMFNETSYYFKNGLYLYISRD